LFRNVGMISLGCAKNRVDAEVMLGLLSNSGYIVVNNSEDADVIIVNTCGFIDSAKQESIEAILEQAEYKKTGRCKALIVTGCMSERYNSELMKEIPEIDAILGTGDYADIVAVLDRVRSGKKECRYGNIDIVPEGVQPRLISTQEVTAYLKIAEGCDNCCTYCVIPSLRGRFRSRPSVDILQEASKLADNGVRELILIAQDVTRYGQDLYDKYNLAALLKDLCRISGLKWIRLLYAYPDRITDELIDVIAGEEKVCNYLDIPIQHINDNILGRMNRTSDSATIRNLVGTLKRRIPDIALRTSLIVGFPGETEAEFNELKDFINEGWFNNVGVFAYSREEGTPAADMPMQISDEIKEERRSMLLSLQRKVSKKLNRTRVGRTCEVLIEGRESANIYFGRSYAEAPEIDGLIYVASERQLRQGEFVRAAISKAYEYDLLGEACANESGK